MRVFAGGSRDASRSSLCSLILTIIAFVAIGAPHALAVEKASEQVSGFYGSFSHSIPIEVPAFRGLEPGLALSYSSEGRNGTAGVGWGLSGFGTVQRVNKGLGSPRFDASDVYLLDGQEMLPCQTGIVSASCASGGNWTTKIESYLKIRFDSGNNSWTVWRKDGTRTIYLPTISVPGNALVPGGVLRWGVSKRIDTDGNEVNYSWTCNSPDFECYPLQATYNGYAVTLFYEARPDHLSWAGASVLGRTTARLRSIIVWAPSHNAHIRGYKLTYLTSALTGRSLLSSVQQYGKDLVHTDGLITAGTSLPAQIFTYQGDNIGRSFVDWSAAPTPPNQTEPVTWANLVNTATAGNGSSLIKYAGGTNWNAGADSSRALAAGDGYLQWTAGDPILEGKAAGLSNGNTDATLIDIDYALVEGPGNALKAYENGMLMGSWTRNSGDLLRIEVSAGVVTYKKNGQPLLQSQRPPLYPLRVDTSIYGVNDVIQSANLSGQLIYVNAWCQAILMSGDFNGDGRTDQLCYTTSGGVARAHVALAGATQFGSPTLWLTGFDLAHSVIADFNNDGMTDLGNHDANTGNFSVALSNGVTAFQTPTVWGNATGAMPGGPLVACVGALARVGTGDFNGDGFTDVFCKRPNFESSYQFVGLSRFQNNTWSFDFSNVFGNFSCDTNEAQVGAMDFDGDGKDDWYCIGAANSTMHVYVSTGSSFLWPAHGGLGICSADGYVFGDFNGDGRTDATCRNNGRVALSMGRSFLDQGEYGGWCGGDYAQAFGADVDGDGSTEIVCNNMGDGATDIQVRKWVGSGQVQQLAPAETWRANWCAGNVSSGDWNGDGKTDLYCTSTVAPAIAGTGGRKVDIASTLANGLGGTVQLGYTPSSAFPNVNNPGVKQTITSLTTSDGRGWSATTTFSYSGGLMDRQERVFLGFRYVKKTLPCLEGESSCPYRETWFKQDLASSGKPETIASRTGGGNLLAMQSFGYQTNGTIVPRVSVLSTETAFSYDGTGCPSSPCGQEKQTTVTHQYDQYGNRTRSTFGGDSADPLDDRSTAWLFTYNTTAYIVGTASEVRNFDHEGTSIAATRYRYDGLAWGAPPQEGHLTHTDRWLKTAGTERWVTSIAGYTPMGSLNYQEDPTGIKSVITYDPVHNIYPATVVNPALPAEAESASWDPICGTTSQYEDANHQITTYQSDALCRKTRTNMPLGGFEEISYRDFGNPNMQRVVVETPPATSGGTKQFAAEHFDGLGRRFMTVAKGPTPTKPIVTIKSFNARGGIASQTAPYYAGDATFATTYSYDALDRITRVTHPDNHTIGKSYGLWSETTTDENEKPLTVYFDAYGRTRVKEETLDGQPVRTLSTYDPLGRLVGLEGPLGATWSWAFDTLGRNLERSDPDSGTWTYQFDDAGRTTLQVDAKQQRTAFSYDVSGRMATRQTYASGSMSPEATVTMTYSQARAGFFNTGRLTTVTGPGTTVLERDHDARGRIAKQRRTLDGVVYGLQTVYDAGDRPLSLQFPDLETYVYSYDEAGRTTSMSALFTEALWDASGRLTRLTNSNGTVTQRSYSPTRGFLTAIQTTGPGSVLLQNLQYFPDPTGRVRSTQSEYPGESWSYSYDDLNRLEAATAVPPSPESQTWAYDEAGRMLMNSRVGTYSYGAQPFHAPTSAGGARYSYDANGNVVRGGGRALTWNADNRLTQANTTQFVYDDAGERLKKTTGASVSRYPFGDDYEITNGVITKYFAVPGMGVIGKRVTGAGTSIPCQLPLDGFYWIHNDRSGSIQAITDIQACEVKRRTYRAYGQTISQSGSLVESRGWIGQRNDEEVAITYLHARYYDPALGLFISPDPASPAARSINSFGYGGGDPINFTDASGLTETPTFPVEVHCPGDPGCPPGPQGPPGADGDQCDPLQHLGCDIFNNPWWTQDDCERYGDCPEHDNNGGGGQNDDTKPDPEPTKPDPVEPTNPDDPSQEPPQFLTPKPKPKHVKLLDEGYKEAQRRLMQPKCSAFYGGLGADTMASTRYHFDSLRRGAGAAYAGEGSGIVFINTGGPYVTSSNGVAVFNDRFGNQIGTHNFGNVTNLRAFMLLHELGHELASETGFQEDAKNPYLNMRQSMTVKDNCF